MSHWTGTVWLPSHSGDVGALGGTGPDDVWAYDRFGPTMQHWDGSVWTAVPLPAPGFAPVAIGGTTTTVLVSSSGGIASWSGAAWKILVGSTATTIAADIIDDTHVVALQYGNVQFWDGASWAAHPPSMSGDWTTITATSFADVTIGGVVANISQPVHLHWDGISWNALGEPSTSPGRSGVLWQSSSGSIWSGFDDAEVYAWDGGAWTPKTVGDNRLRAVWGTDEDDIWTVGEYINAPRLRAKHWDGSSWLDVELPSGATDRLGKLWGRASDDVWIAAGRSVSGGIERYLFHWNGATWVSIGPLGIDRTVIGGFESVWASGPTDVYAVSPTSLYHFDGAAWTKLASVPGGSDVFGTASDDVYVCNGSILWHWDGSAWTSMSPPSAVVVGVATSPTDVWLGGQDAMGPVIHFDGTTFSAQQARSVRGFAGSANEMYGFLDSDIVEWSGGFNGTKTTIYAPTLGLTPGWVAPNGALYVGGLGLIVHGP